MAGDREVKIRVKLDTAAARAELQGLVASAQSAGVGTGGRSAGGSAVGDDGAGGGGGGFTLASVMRGMGLGTGFAMAQHALSGPTSSGVGSVLSEALGPLGAAISKWALGDMPAEAKAAESAREDTIASFGRLAGIQGQIPGGAKSFFDARKGIALQAEKGSALFERDKDFRGVDIPDLGELLFKLSKQWAELQVNAIKEGFRALNEALKHLVGGPR